MIKAPRDLGGISHFEMLTDELGERYVRELLQVSRQQLAAWRRPQATVPRAVLLALYWESRWGRSVIDSERESEIANLHGLVQAYRCDIETLKVRVSTLLAELRRAAEDGRRGCANDLWFDLLRSEHPRKGELRSPHREFVDKWNLTR